MAFKRFAKIGRSFAAKVSIRTNGQIGFSQGSVKKFNIGDYKYCQIYFDEQLNKIGLLFTKENDGMCANVFNKRNNCYIAAKTFFDYYDISYAKTKSFIVSKDEETGFIIIDLNRPQGSGQED